MRIFSISVITFILLSVNSFAQSLTAKEIEDDLMQEYSKLVNFDRHNYNAVYYHDSIFRNKITNYTHRFPFTLTYPFQKLIDSCNIGVITSNDGFFRIYSWDTWSGGGTERFYNNVFQFRSGNNVYAKLLYDSSEDAPAALSFYSDVYTLHANKKTYYLGIDHYILSSSDLGQSIRIFCIEDNNLNDSIELIKTDAGLQNQVFVEYDFSSYVNREMDSGKQIKYDADKKIIYVPLVLENGKITDEYVLYRFNGKYFEKLKK